MRFRINVTLFVAMIVALGLTAGVANALTEFFEDFEGISGRLADHADWIADPRSGTSGPTVNAGIGVNGSKGITASGDVITWVGHPFEWADLAVGDVVIAGLDFEGGAGGDGPLDDDRVGWKINDDTDSSDYIFGVQGDSGGGGQNIECYWDSVGWGGNEGRDLIVATTPVVGTWYRLTATFTKLTETSCSIDVELIELDSSGNPTSTVFTGNYPDTALDDTPPNVEYFAGLAPFAPNLWPGYKNHSNTGAAADNAYFAYGPLTPAAELVSPIDWAYVDVAELVWLRPDPMNEGDPGVVTVNVYFGTDPNLIVGLNGTVQAETGTAVDSTSNFGTPLDMDTVYYWRVDVIDPNYGAPTTFEGATWSFITTVPEEVMITESDGSTDISEQDPIPNRDDYILSLSKDPVVPVSITITEVPTNNPLTDTREEMESWNGEATAAPLLQVTHSGGIPILSRVNADDDDLEEYIDDGEEQGNGSSDLEFFDDTGTGRQQMIALRFNSVSIPQGAVINSAVVEFEVDVARGGGEVHGIVTGEAVVDSPPLVDATFHIRDRLAANPTSATVTFIWAGNYAVDEKVPTSDIAAIIQEIVDQPTWVSGYSIVLFFTENMYPDVADIDFIDATDPWALRSSTYVLDSGNWEGVTVTIAAIDDDDLETDPDLITLTARTSSTDPDWTGVAVADVIVSIGENECGAWSFKAYDFDENCYVDMGDLAMILDEWLTCTTPNVIGSGCVETYRP